METKPATDASKWDTAAPGRKVTGEWRLLTGGLLGRQGREMMRKDLTEVKISSQHFLYQCYHTSLGVIIVSAGVYCLLL